MTDASRVAGLAVATVVAAMLWTTAASAQNQPGSQATPVFGGDYDTLNDIQRALVDDLYKRAGAVLGVALDSKEQYNSARLSARTTFDAVTHALTRSTLTDRDSGQLLGRPIELIDYVETVEGQVRGAPGDLQFRVYVSLKPGSVDLLARSREFSRTADNTIFHKGYPTSYRQDGYPSVQFSVTADGGRADIDVDYRSSRFPAALLNGHLTAANSDVRAGNYERHNSRWSGLVNWWEGFLGGLFAARVDVPEDAGRIFPTVPRAGGKTIDVAVDDFLTSWLVEGNPALAVAYADPATYDCLAMRLEQEGRTLDRGLAPLQLYARMKTVNDAIGPRTSLDGTTRGLRLADPALKLVTHRRPAQYSIYAVPRVMADQMACGSYTTFGVLPPAPTARWSRDPYESFYSTFVIVGGDGASVSLGLLWQRRRGQWKIVSYQLAQEAAEGATSIPDLRRTVTAVDVPRMQADPVLVAASERFLEDWLVHKRYDRAFAAISPRCYACVNLYLDPDESPKTTADDQRIRLRTGLQRVGERVGQVKRLEDIIKKVDPADPRLRIVDHRRGAAFGLLALPDWAGPVSECEIRLARGDEVLTTEGARRADQGYGRYFATALQFIPRAGETAVLFLAWEHDGGRWRIFAYKIVVP